MVSDIFVSYKKENRAYAEQFANCFAEQGFSVWWDEDITPRQAWDVTIEREIETATSVVVLWSPLSVNSDWVRNEAHYGHDRNKLVPVMIERCDLPLAFRLTQTVDLCGWDGDRANRQWRKLVTWISDLKATAGHSATASAPAKPFRTAVGQLDSGEPIVDGAFVNAATPAGTLFRDHPDAPIMRILPRGDFLLGGAPGDPERTSVETPQKRIDIARPFAMSVYPVIQAQYERYGTRPPAFPPQAVAQGGWFRHRKAMDAPAVAPISPECTATGISFGDAVCFARALSAAVSVPYRLPSEAEWEYACRGGSRTRYSWGDDIDASRALYRCAQSTPAGPHTPGRFAPNAFGLYDMHGNVREWTEDLWHESHDLIPPDGRPVVDGHSAMRVTRGGGWSDPGSMLRSSARSRATETIRSDVIGLRVVRVL
jgi:formylglycine-generating enzyme required for sulfatase activity